MLLKSNIHFLYISRRHVRLYNIERCLWENNYNSDFWEEENITPISNLLPRQACVQILLSNEFYRLLLISWSNHLHNKEDIKQYACSLFKDLLGNHVDLNSVKIAVQGYKKSFLASYILDGITEKISSYTKKLLPHNDIISYTPIAIALVDSMPFNKNTVFVFNDYNTAISFYYEEATLLDIETYGNETQSAESLFNGVNRQLLRLGKSNINIRYCSVNQIKNPLSSISNWVELPLQTLLNKKRSYLINKINPFSLSHINHHLTSFSFIKKRFFFLATILVSVLFFISIKNISDQKSKFELQKNMLKQTLHQLEEKLEADNEKYFEKVRYIQLNNLLKPKRILWDTLYAELEILNYEDIRIISIDINGENNIIEINAEAKSLKAVNDLLAEIEKSDIFSDSHLVRHSKQLNAIPQKINFVIRSNF